jgi:hypothetical protein
MPIPLSQQLKNFEPAFTQPSFARFCYPAMATVVTTVRRYLWTEWVVENLPGSEAVAKLFLKPKNTLPNAPALAA